MSYSKASKRMSNKTLYAAKVVIDCFNHINIQRQRDLFARRNTMGRCVKGQHLIIMINQRTHIGVEIFCRRFKSVEDKDAPCSALVPFISTHRNTLYIYL